MRDPEAHIRPAPAGLPADAGRSPGERLYALGRVGWPDLSVSPRGFAAFVVDGEPVPESHAADLYLACACADGDRSAHAAYALLCRPIIERALRRLDADGDTLGDQIQDVLTAILHGIDGVPRIRHYTGRGPLISWTAVVATRHGLDVLRLAGRLPDRIGAGLEHLGSPIEDAELRYMKRVYAGAMREALVAALAALSPRARRLLRYHTVERLGIDAIALLQGVHRATAARWLAQARADLMRQTRARLMRRTGLSDSEANSIGRLVIGQIDVSLMRLLSEPTSS